MAFSSCGQGIHPFGPSLDSQALGRPVAARTACTPHSRTTRATAPNPALVRISRPDGHENPSDDPAPSIARNEIIAPTPSRAPPMSQTITRAENRTAGGRCRSFITGSTRRRNASSTQCPPKVNHSATTTRPSQPQHAFELEGRPTVASVTTDPITTANGTVRSSVARSGSEPAGLSVIDDTA